MTIPTRTLFPFTSALNSAVFALIGAATLSFSTPAAYAGAAEKSALIAALGLSDPKQATSQQLYDAWKAVIADVKFDKATKYGVVLGEALKLAGPNAVDAGEFFGMEIPGDANPKVQAAFSAPSSLISLAAKTAGTGKDLNVSQIPDLVAELLPILPGNDNDEATAFAIAAANKAGAGAILGGAASLLSDNDATTFAITSIGNKKFTAATQEVVQWIATTIDDTASYAASVANAPLNFKVAAKIATGASAGDPTNAGNIVHGLFGQNLLDDTTGALTAPTVAGNTDVQAALNKASTVLAKTVGAVADIEEIQKIGNAFGQQIGKPSAANPLKGDIGLAKAATIVKTLATAIMDKPLVDRNGVQIARNQFANKSDEIPEVAAYVLGGLLTSPELLFNTTNPDLKKAAAAGKKAANTILAIIKAAAGVKPKTLTVAGVKTPQGPNADTGFAADTAASVLLTVLNGGLPASITDALNTLLLARDKNGVPTTKTAAAINKLDAARILARIQEVYAGTNLGRFEDGNTPINAISDPETDFRPFS